MIRSQFKQSARFVSINSINESSSIPAATEAAELHYTQNPDFPTSSGETIAEMMHRKQEILQGDRKASTATTKRLTKASTATIDMPISTVQGFRGANELGLTRVQTLKQRDEYIAVTARHAVRNDYARDNELGLTRVETIKQQVAYTTATLQQNDAQVSHGNDGDIELAAGIIGGGGSREANAVETVGPGVVMYVPNSNDNVVSNIAFEPFSLFNFIYLFTNVYAILDVRGNFLI